MNDQQNQRIIAAAGFFNTALRNGLTSNHGIHAETIIAAAGRMAGTKLFRSFGVPEALLAAGQKEFSGQANVAGPKLMNVMLVTLRHLGHNITDELVVEKYGRTVTTTLSTLTLQQVWQRFDAPYLQYVKAKNISFEDAAFGSAMASGMLIHDCREVFDPYKGAALAVYGMVEGAKTAPPIGGTSKAGGSSARNT